MSEIAHEVSRRMTPHYAKERAREMARDRMMRVKESATESSWFAPALGAGLGALVAKAIQSRAQERSGYVRWEEGRGGWRYGSEGRDVGFRGDDLRYPYAREGEWVGPEGAEGFGARDPAEGLEARDAEERGRLSSAGAKASEKASELKDRAQSAAQDVKERVQGATRAVRERLPDRERLRASAHDDVGLWALGAIALGALFGFALPVSQREREALEPAARKARELGEQVKEKALEQGSAAMDRASERLEGVGGSQPRAEPGAAGGVDLPGSPTPIH